MITIRSYCPDKHYPIMAQLYKARGLRVPPQDEVPKTGVAILSQYCPNSQDRDKIVAIGFLRMVEGGFAQIDGLITNPRHDGEVRDLANDMLTQELIEIAKKRNIKAVIANSTDTHTIQRAERHGFVVLPHKLFVKNLSNNDKVAD